MESLKENIENIITKLKVLDIELHELETLTEKALAEVKADYQNQIEALFLRKETLTTNLKQLQEAGKNVWEDMKAGTELSWEVFRDSVKSEFKKKKQT
jgi:hypothetical protein